MDSEVIHHAPGDGMGQVVLRCCFRSIYLAGFCPEGESPLWRRRRYLLMAHMARTGTRPTQPVRHVQGPAWRLAGSAKTCRHTSIDGYEVLHCLQSLG